MNGKYALLYWHGEYFILLIGDITSADFRMGSQTYTPEGDTLDPTTGTLIGFFGSTILYRKSNEGIGNGASTLTELSIFDTEKEAYLALADKLDARAALKEAEAIAARDNADAIRVEKDK